jgi:hypothetical protein
VTARESTMATGLFAILSFLSERVEGGFAKGECHRLRSKLHS